MCKGFNKYYSDSENLNRSFFNSHKPSVLKLHGDIERSESIIISKQDYENFRLKDEFKKIRECIRNNFSSNINIFLGYSLNDYHIKEFLEQNNKIYGEDKEKSYIIIKPSNSKEDNEKITEYYRTLSVETVEINHFKEIFTALNRLDNIYNIEDKVKKNLAIGFQEQKIIEPIVENYEFWESCCRALAFLNEGLIDLSLEAFEELLEVNKSRSGVNWQYIYLIYGAILEYKGLNKNKSKEDDFINKALELSDYSDEIFEELSKTFIAISTNNKMNINDLKKIKKPKNKQNFILKALDFAEKIKIDTPNKYYQIILCNMILEKYEVIFKIIYDLNENIRNQYSVMKISAYALFKYFDYLDKRIIGTENCNFEYLNNLKNIALEEGVKLFQKCINNHEFEKESIIEKNSIYDLSIMMLIRLNRYLEAEEYCNKIKGQDSLNNHTHIYRLEIYVKKKQYNEVIHECDYLLSQIKEGDRSYEQIVFTKAQCLFSRARYYHEVIEAIELCEKIAESNYQDVLWFMANMYNKIKKNNKFREYILKAYYIDPTNNHIYNIAKDIMSGHFFGEEEEYDFLTFANELLKIEKARNDSINNKEVNKGKKALYKIFALNNNDLLRLRIYDDINIDDFMSAIKGKSNIKDVGVINKLIYHYNLSEFDEVENYLKKLKRYNNNMIYKYINANTLMNKKKFEEGYNIYCEFLDVGIENFPINVQGMICYYLGTYFEYKKDYKKAIEYLELCNYKEIIVPLAFSQLGLIYGKLSINNNIIYDEMSNKSIYYFKKYLYYYDGAFEAHENIAILEYCSGNLKEALYHSGEFKKYMPNDLNRILENYIRIIKISILLEDDEKARFNINETEYMMKDKISKVKKEIIYEFYYYKAAYQSNYSYEETLESLSKARAFKVNDKSERDLSNWENKSNIFNFQYGDRFLSRGRCLVNKARTIDGN